MGAFSPLHPSPAPSPLWLGSPWMRRCDPEQADPARGGCAQGVAGPGLASTCRGPSVAFCIVRDAKCKTDPCLTSLFRSLFVPVSLVAFVGLSNKTETVNAGMLAQLNAVFAVAMRGRV